MLPREAVRQVDFNTVVCTFLSCSNASGRMCWQNLGPREWCQLHFIECLTTCMVILGKFLKQVFSNFCSGVSVRVGHREHKDATRFLRHKQLSSCRFIKFGGRVLTGLKFVDFLLMTSMCHFSVLSKHIVGGRAVVQSHFSHFTGNELLYFIENKFLMHRCCLLKPSLPLCTFIVLPSIPPCGVLRAQSRPVFVTTV